MEGTFPVRLGASLGGDSITSGLHTFRYNFKPDGLDSTSGGTVTRDDRTGAWRAAFNSETGPISYNGTHSAQTKRTDVVLIFNAEKREFVMERVASNFQFELERRVAGGQGARASAPPPRRAEKVSQPASPASSSDSEADSGSQKQQEAPRSKERDEKDSKKRSESSRTDDAKKDVPLPKKAPSGDKRPRTLDGRVIPDRKSNLSDDE